MNKPVKPETYNVDLTSEDSEVMRILANVADLPIQKTLTLPDIARDGYGGMVVKRHNLKTYVFQRELSRERSRWADSLADCIAEIRQYVRTGALPAPDQCGF